ncbi:MAG TPA: DUF4271 domain-containing protein [Flavisolibacter sp.]|nr:DUF4271 domain-containing protein [Flavisolibacter sp.]
MRFSLLILGLLLHFSVLGQADSIQRSDSIVTGLDTLARTDTVLAVDTVKPIVLEPPYIRFDTLLYKQHPFFKIDNPIHFIAPQRIWNGKDALFYACIGLLLFFAIVRNAFQRYLQDLFRLFFRTTMKQRQVKEQMMASPLPSLLLNLLFMLSGGMLITLLLQHYGLGEQYNFWQLLLYAVVGLGLIYLIKFISLKLCGWLFRLSEATDAYTFIVFTTNKVLGIAWLPFIILIVFTNGLSQQLFITATLIVTGGAFLYRFFLSYATIHRGIKLNPFHFILYLCAFEIAPLLLINKLLFTYLS